jgi:hypothetical protein
MCGGNAWELEGWRPFADIERTGDVELAAEDAPLTRERRPPFAALDSAFPGVPFS